MNDFVFSNNEYFRNPVSIASFFSVAQSERVRFVFEWLKLKIGA